MCEAPTQFLSTAGGLIKCLRCTALSTRTKQQCGKPALKSSKQQRCGHHGGLSTGPKTAEGKARSIAAHTTHGQATNAARRERSQASLRLAQLADVFHLLQLGTAPRIRGRKPSGYCPIKTLAQAQAFLFDMTLNTVAGRRD
jgi:hypothetical protein